jgi:hypothetical protein
MMERLEMNALFDWIDEIPHLLILVFICAIILSVEILHHQFASRVLCSGMMLYIWFGLLSSTFQFKAILGATLFHCLREIYIEYILGFPLYQQGNQERIAVLWALYWMRIFVWGCTFGTNIYSHFETPFVGIFIGTIYCELVEVLLLLYFADQHVPYVWRRRIMLWVLSGLVGLLEYSSVLDWIVENLSQHISLFYLILILMFSMWVSMRLPWYHWLKRNIHHDHID